MALETAIDKAMGIGNYVNANSSIGKERTTATEVDAVKAAGGNRLNGVHSHMEVTTFLPFLEKVVQGCQQYIDKDEVIRIAGKSKLAALAMQVDRSILNPASTKLSASLRARA